MTDNPLLVIKPAARVAQIYIMDSKGDKAKKTNKLRYSWGEFVCPEGQKTRTLWPKVRSNGVRYNRSIFVRVL